MILTCTDDLNAQFPAVAARAVGLDRVPLLCTRELDVPGAMERVIRVLAHYYAPADHVPPTSTWGRRRGSEPISTPLNEQSNEPEIMTVPSLRSSRSIPGYEAGAPAGKAPESIAAEGIAQLASNESPWGPHPAVAEAVARAAAASHRYPDPSASLLAPADRRALTRSIRPRSRSRTAPARSCSRPGWRSASRAPRSSTRGRRSRIYPHIAPLSGAREIRVPLADGDLHDLDAMLAEVTAATQLVLICNPNNPTATHLPAAKIAEFCARVPGPRHGARRRGLRRVPARRRPGR